MNLKQTAAALALAVASTGAAVAGPAWTSTNPDGFRNSSWSFGDVFTVGANDILLTALGAVDIGLDGFLTQGGIQVGLYRESDGALLASANVLSSDAATGSYRFADIADIVLAANTQYRVVAVNGDDLYNVALGTPDNVSSLISWNRYGYCQTTALTRCDTWTGTERSWMANMMIEPQAPSAEVPVPATPALFGLAGLAMALLRRKRNA